MEPNAVVPVANVVVVDPRDYALKVVMYRALSGVLMVGMYALFEVASIYIYSWLATQQLPQQPLQPPQQ